MQPLIVFQPLQVLNDRVDMAPYARKFLAQGDSWFSFGSLNPAKNSNLLFEMAFTQSFCAIDCASPGDTLRHMVSMSQEPQFAGLLQGRVAWPWDGLILSAGGNDLIAALDVPPDVADPALRLLRVEAEWGPESDGAARYVSDAGWQTFCTYLLANLDVLIRMREAGPSAGKPIFMHTYAYPVPRPAGPGLGLHPWLMPALQAYGVPNADWTAVAHELVSRLVQLLQSAAANAARFPNLNVFDTTAIAITPADPTSTGESGDWLNEIHLTWQGYEKLALPWAQAIEAAVA